MEVDSIDASTLADLSTDEREAQLAAEDFDPRSEIWTGCGRESLALGGG